MCERRDETQKRQTPAPIAIGFRGLIRFYQLTISSLFGRRCRYLPTCSDYAMDAIRQHGAWAGFWLGLAGMAACHVAAEIRRRR
jgi:putative membrane protein insertion efficiency factor